MIGFKDGRCALKILSFPIYSQIDLWWAVWPSKVNILPDCYLDVVLASQFDSKASFIFDKIHFAIQIQSDFRCS